MPALNPSACTHLSAPPAKKVLPDALSLLAGGRAPRAAHARHLCPHHRARAADVWRRGGRLGAHGARVVAPAAGRPVRRRGQARLQGDAQHHQEAQREPPAAAAAAGQGADEPNVGRNAAVGPHAQPGHGS